MRRLLLPAAALLLAGAVAACSPEPATRVGIFIPLSVNDGAVTYTPEGIATEASALGVDVARFQQVVGRRPAEALQVLAERGVGAQLTAKSPQFGRLPDDLDQYETDLAALLRDQPTGLLAVQNEETVDKFWLDTIDNYLVLLRAAARVANAEGVPVTNGGIDRQPTALATWNHLRRTRGTATADSFLDAVFDTAPGIRNALTGVPPSDPDPYRRVNETVARRWRDGEYLLERYGSDPGDVPITYVNFHWYVSDDTPEGFRGSGPYTDTDALRDVVRFIEGSTGKRAVTNEIGQWGRTPEAVTAFLGLLRDELHVPWVIWFDADGVPADGLHESGQPGELRANGTAFAAAVRSK
ncbi:hypothetical protein BH18ACT1_BH18ACT1_00140 [soil metagenome]